MYVAQPYLANKRDSKEFETKKQAKKYLEEFTEISMPMDEWEMLGKIYEKSE